MLKFCPYIYNYNFYFKAEFPSNPYFWLVNLWHAFLRSVCLILYKHYVVTRATLKCAIWPLFHYKVVIINNELLCSRVYNKITTFFFSVPTENNAYGVILSVGTKNLLLFCDKHRDKVIYYIYIYIYIYISVCVCVCVCLLGDWVP